MFDSKFLGNILYLVYGQKTANSHDIFNVFVIYDYCYTKNGKIELKNPC